MKARLFLILGVILVASARPQAHPGSTPSPMPPEQVKANFLRMLDRSRVPLTVRTIEVKPPARGVISERVDFATELRQDGSIERVPALVVRPEGAKPGARMPAVVVLHGTGGRKEAMWPWLEQLAHRGILAIAIDGRYHGERKGGTEGTKLYNEAIAKAWRTKLGDKQEHPFYYDTCWDIWRTLDYLETRADVDPHRIGMIGESKGGIETWLAAAVDERVKVAIPAIAMQSFRFGLDHDHWQARANTVRQAHEAAAADLGRPEIDSGVCEVMWAKLLPGIRDIYDGPSMVRLFAGRPLLILNGELDPNCPIDGAELAFASARAAFHEIDADDHLKIMIAKGVKHQIDPRQHEAALDWCVTWLKPDVPERMARMLKLRAQAASLVGPPAPRVRRDPSEDRAEHPRPLRRPFGRRADLVGPPMLLPSVRSTPPPPAPISTR